MWLLIFSLWHQKENKGIWNANTFIYKKDWYKNKSELKKKIDKKTQSKGRDQKIRSTPLPMEALIKNQNKNNFKL